MCMKPCLKKTNKEKKPTKYFTYDLYFVCMSVLSAHV